MTNLPQILHDSAVKLRVRYQTIDQATIEFILREGATIAAEEAAKMLNQMHRANVRARNKSNLPQ